MGRSEQFVIRRMMGRTAPSYLLLLLIGCSFFANVLANLDGKDKKPEELKHKDHEEGKKDLEYHKDRKDNDDHKHDHKNKEQSKEDAYEVLLEMLKTFKEDLLEKCGKGDSVNDREHSLEDKNDEKKYDKDSGKGKDDRKSATLVHHYHHYCTDGGIKTYSTNNKEGSSHYLHTRDDGKKYPGGHHYDCHDHRDRAGGHEYGDHTHHDVYQGRTEPIPFDYGHSNGRHVPHHYEGGKNNGDEIHHHPQDTHNLEPYTHSKYPNERHGQRSEPRNSRYHDEYNHSHPKYEQHHYQHLDGGATHDICAEPMRERTHYGRQTLNHDDGVRTNQHHYGPESHRIDRPQYLQNGKTYVTYSLPESSQPQQEWIAHKEPNTYKQPKTSQGAIAHVCHYHDHVLRVEEQNLQNQQQLVEDSNLYSHPAAHQPSASCPVGITSILDIPAPLDSACAGIKQPQPTPICHEPRPPQQPCSKPKEDKPVYMICVQKELETQCEPPRADPSPCQPPRKGPACPPPNIDICLNSYKHQLQQQNIYSNPC